jgi:hypothetical protein
VAAKLQDRRQAGQRGQPLIGPTGRPVKGYETNGLPRQPGAPYAEPCRSDPTPANNWQVTQTGRARTYKGANIQIDAVINKLGWHFPQQRLITLWADVAATLSRARAPEPLVMRVSTSMTAGPTSTPTWCRTSTSWTTSRSARPPMSSASTSTW